DRSSHVLRARDPPQRDGPLDIPFPLSLFPAVRLLGHFGIDPSRRDAVHRDARRELNGERLGEGDDGTLGGRVIGVECLAPLPGDRIPQITRDRYRPRPPSTALDRLDRLFGLRPPAAVPDRHACARPGEQQRGRPPDPAAAAGDERALARQRDHSLRVASTMSQMTCSTASCSSWMREVSSAGMTRQSSTTPRASPPPLPSSATTRTPLARAAWAPRTTFGLSPLVECSTTRSPGRASASIWRAKISSKPRSLPHAVSSEVSVVNAIAGSARRLRL